MSVSSSRTGSRIYADVLGFTFMHWKRQRARGLAVALFIMLGTLAEIFTPFYAGRLVDAIASGAATDVSVRGLAWYALAMLIGLGVAGVVFRQLAFHNIIPLTLTMMRDAVSESFHRVQRFSTDWHANSFAGSTVRRMTRGMWAFDLLNDTLVIALFPSLVMLVGATLILGWHWPVMGVVIGLGALLYITVTTFISLRIVAPAARLANTWDTRLGGALADAVSCNAVVKAFGAERREEVRIDGVVRKWRDRTRRTWKLATFNGGLQGLMLLLMKAGVLGTGVYLWQSGSASAGDITFVLSLFLVLQGHLRDVGMHIRNLQRSVNDMEEMVALSKMPPGVADAPDAQDITLTDGSIAFENVTFRYGAQAAPLYRDFNIQIKAGERVGLVGHSGSGKTTFVKLVQRLYDVDSGRILLDGHDIAGLSQASLRAQIAIVPQEPILFHRSLAENIAYARPGATRAQVEHAAELANAHDFITRLPKGYETLVGERGVKLSGGERQRVALARAFLADAPVLILDEATSSLDSESERLIQDAMARLMMGRTTLVIAHRLSTVTSLDRLLVFDRGQVVEQGTHQQLVRLSGGIYRRLFERQALDLTTAMEETI